MIIKLRSDCMEISLSNSNTRDKACLYKRPRKKNSALKYYFGRSSGKISMTSVLNRAVLLHAHYIFVFSFPE